METTPTTKQRPYQMFAVGDYERVIAHGTRQLQRGRRPSMAFGECRDPRTALRYAVGVAHGDLVLPPGTIIDVCNGIGVTARVNEKFTTIKPGQSIVISVDDDQYGSIPFSATITQMAHSYDPNADRPNPRAMIYFEGEADSQAVFGYIERDQAAVVVLHHPLSSQVTDELTRQHEAIFGKIGPYKGIGTAARA